MSNGIITTTTVEIDWLGLGEHLATVTDIDQANVLACFAEMLHRLPGVDGEMQLQYVADIFNMWQGDPEAAETVKHLKWMLAGLLERLA